MKLLYKGFFSAELNDIFLKTQGLHFIHIMQLLRTGVFIVLSFYFYKTV